MQQVYPIFKVHSGSANRNENGGRCCIRKESAVTRKKGCPDVEPDIPNDLIKRQYLNLVCGSGMRHTYCRVGTHSPSEQLPVSLVLVRPVGRTQPTKTANTYVPTLPIPLCFYYSPLGRICKKNLLPSHNSVICAENLPQNKSLLR